MSFRSAALTINSYHPADVGPITLIHTHTHTLMLHTHTYTHIHVCYTHTNEAQQSCHTLMNHSCLRYGVASVSRIDKIIGQFCKRDL